MPARIRAAASGAARGVHLRGAEDAARAGRRAGDVAGEHVGHVGDAQRGGQVPAGEETGIPGPGPETGEA
jgi:hypothetical protein